MKDFVYYNPTRIVFGRASMDHLRTLVRGDSRVLLTYGSGSIKRNGVYDKVLAALDGREVLEFGGIEPNPEYEMLLEAAKIARENEVSFLLSVGGGSVLDGTKFIAAAAKYDGSDPWRIITKRGSVVEAAIPIGAVLTLPGTGSEANPNAVISRREIGEKRHFSAEAVFPVFSILDPETTYSLPTHQLRNGIVDTFVHVMEQYATFPGKAPLQARQAEAILATLLERASAMLEIPPAYNARADLMWCATQALNGVIGLGVPQDWSTHMVGHELTAIYGLDHAVTLAIVLPGMLSHQIDVKRAMLEQYGHRVFGVGSAEEAILRTESFFREIGMLTRFSEHGIEGHEAAERVAARLEQRGARLGEHADLDSGAIRDVLLSRV